MVVLMLGWAERDRKAAYLSRSSPSPPTTPPLPPTLLPLLTQVAEYWCRRTVPRNLAWPPDLHAQPIVGFQTPLWHAMEGENPHPHQQRRTSFL